MGTAANISGEHYGRLLVVERAGSNRHKNASLQRGGVRKKPLERRL